MNVIAITFAIATVLGIGAHYVAGWSAGYVMLGVLVGLPLMGVLITLDDDLPGGWSNPDGKTRPPWRYWQCWAEVGVRASLAGVGFAVDFGWLTAEAAIAWGIALIGAGAGAYVMRRPIVAQS